MQEKQTSRHISWCWCYNFTKFDTPANFTGAAGKTLKVNSSGNAVEFVTVTTPAGNFAGLQIHLLV